MMKFFRKKSPRRKNPVSELGIGNARAQLHLVRSLKSIREQNAISVEELAELIGVDASLINRFEKGGVNFTMSTLRDYAEAVHAKLELAAYPEREGIVNDAGHFRHSQPLTWSSEISVQRQSRIFPQDWIHGDSPSTEIVELSR